MQSTPVLSDRPPLNHQPTQDQVGSRSRVFADVATIASLHCPQSCEVRDRKSVASTVRMTVQCNTFGRAINTLCAAAQSLVSYLPSCAFRAAVVKQFASNHLPPRLPACRLAVDGKKRDAHTSTRVSKGSMVADTCARGTKFDVSSALGGSLVHSQVCSLGLCWFGLS